MSIYSQSELLRRSAALVTYGLNAKAQVILAHAGYTPGELNNGAEKIACVKKTAIAHTEAAALERKNARLGKIAHEAVQKELKCFSEATLVLSSRDHPVFKSFNNHHSDEIILQFQNGEAKKISTNGVNTGTALEDWRALLANTGTLEECSQQELAAADWPSSRVINAYTLINAYQTVRMDQKTASDASQTASQAYKAANKDLERWYIKARRLCRKAIQDADPIDAQILIERLGLD